MGAATAAPRPARTLRVGDLLPDGYAKSGLDPRGLADGDASARFVRLDEPLFPRDTLRFVVPGAGGCGIIKGCMAVPETAMLFAAPASCARHGSVIAYRDGWRDRVAFLDVGESDFVMGANVGMIERGVAELLETCTPAPRAVFVCGTCVDDLLGTDLTGICRSLSARHGIPFSECRLDPVTKTSSTPPPVKLQRSVFRLLVQAGPAETDPDAVNVIEGFTRIDGRSDLFDVLAQAGFSTVRQVAGCATYDEFLDMRRASVNVLLRSFGRPACKDMERALGIPFCSMRTYLLPELVDREYARLAQGLGARGAGLDWSGLRAAAEGRLERAGERLRGLRVAVGSYGGASAFEIACLLARLGAEVRVVLEDRIATPDWPIVEELRRRCPDAVVVSPNDIAFGLGAGMPLAGDPGAGAGVGAGVDLAIGYEAGRLLPGVPTLGGDYDRLQVVGFSAAAVLLEEAVAALDAGLCARDIYRERSRAAASCRFWDVLDERPSTVSGAGEGRDA